MHNSTYVSSEVARYRRQDMVTEARRLRLAAQLRVPPREPGRGRRTRQKLAGRFLGVAAQLRLASRP
jgi:hypothetical protein